MTAQGGEGGQKQDKTGLAPSFRWGIGTRDEFLVSLYHLDNHNGVNYGLPFSPDSVRLLIQVEAVKQ
mgnify:CR=1 FL=1